MVTVTEAIDQSGVPEDCGYGFDKPFTYSLRIPINSIELIQVNTDSKTERWKGWDVEGRAFVLEDLEGLRRVYKTNSKLVDIKIGGFTELREQFAGIEAESVVRAWRRYLKGTRKSCPGIVNMS